MSKVVYVAGTTDPALMQANACVAAHFFVVFVVHAHVAMGAQIGLFQLFVIPTAKSKGYVRNHFARTVITKHLVLVYTSAYVGNHGAMVAVQMGNAPMPEMDVFTALHMDWG